MAGDNTFHQRRTGSRLSHYKYGRSAFVSWLAPIHPVPGKGIGECIVHLDLCLLIEIDNAASGGRAAGKGCKRAVLILQIFELLAQPIVEKRKPLGVPAFLLYESL